MHHGAHQEGEAAKHFSFPTLANPYQNRWQNDSNPKTPNWSTPQQKWEPKPHVRSCPRLYHRRGTHQAVHCLPLRHIRWIHHGHDPRRHRLQSLHRHQARPMAQPKRIVSSLQDRSSHFNGSAPKPTVSDRETLGLYSPRPTGLLLRGRP